MNNNNQSNKLIKWTVTVGDFIVLNLLIFAFAKWHWRMGTWPEGRVEIFLLINNIALMLSMMQFSTVIHLRMINAGEILRRAIGLTSLQAVISFLLLKMISGDLPIGWLIFEIGSVYVAVLVVKRLSERFVVKWYREAGRNIRMITLVGTDPELQIVYKKLKDDPTLGYHVLGYYGDDTVAERVGSVEDFLKAIETPESLFLGEELYLCVGSFLFATVNVIIGVHIPLPCTFERSTNHKVLIARCE
jgi:putative colanic acid biosynthesis UDP-glucose lipid carrier transferase